MASPDISSGMLKEVSMKQVLLIAFSLILCTVPTFGQMVEEEIDFSNVVAIFEKSPELNAPLMEWFQESPDDPRPLIILAYSSSDKLHEMGLIDRSEAVAIGSDSDEFLTLCDTALAPYYSSGELLLTWVVPQENGFHHAIIDVFSGQILEIRELIENPNHDRATSVRRQAVVREANYALRGSDGIVGKTYNNCYAGDWDYVNSNPSIRNTAAGKYTPGTYGRDQYGFGLGGYCKFFAGIVVRRGTGDFWIPTNQTLYDSGAHAKYTRTGHVLQKDPNSPHTAIVIAILCYDSSGYVTGVDVIDSNFLRRMTIGQHPIFSNGSGYSKLYNYHTWSSY